MNKSALNRSILFEMTDFELGGIQEVTVNLANHFYHHGYSIFIAVPKRNIRNDFQSSRLNKSIQILYLTGGIYCQMVLLAKFLFFNKIDVYFPIKNKLRFIAILMRIPVIIKILHNCYSYSIKERSFEQFLKHFSSFVAVSNVVKEYSIKALSLEADQVRVVYNGVDLNKFNPPLMRDFSEIRVCSVGRLVPQKGFDTMITIASHFKEYPKLVQFIIIGDGPKLQALTDQARAIDPQGKLIIFHGATSDVAGILKECHIYMATPRYAGFEIVLTEAMATGLPVIAFDVGPVKEVIGENGPGILIKNGDVGEFVLGLKYLIGDPDKIQAIGRKCRERVEQLFSAEVYLEKYGTLVEELLNKNNLLHKA